MLVQNFLIDSSIKLPDKTALLCDNQRLTYKQVNEQSNKLANALIEYGVNRWDRVVVFLPNSTEAVLSIFAILKASATFVVINPTIKNDKLIYILNNCNAKALITTSRNRKLVLNIQQKVSSLKFAVICNNSSSEALKKPFYDFEEILSSFPSTTPECYSIDQDLACLIYTSGSTGEPKGVMSGHNNVVFAADSIITYIENTADDIICNALPLSFDYGLYQLLMTFRFGGTLILEKSFTYAAQVLKRIELERVTGFPLVPTMATLMLQMDLSDFNFESLRYITNTAAALPPQHITKLQKKLPHVAIYSMYGLTECKRTLYLPPKLLREKPGSVGIAIPGTEVWIEDENGNRLEPLEIGELVIRGSHVMRGYWKDPETTKRVFKEGPYPGERILYSGDLFKVDKDGHHYFIARKDDIIKSQGEKVSPKEVENIIYSMEGIIEAAVIGVEDKLLGQAIKAFVTVSNKEINEKSILRYCREHLENYMVPQYVEICKSLPKTSSGKIKKTDLK